LLKKLKWVFTTHLKFLNDFQFHFKIRTGHSARDLILSLLCCRNSNPGRMLMQSTAVVALACSGYLAKNGRFVSSLQTGVYPCFCDFLCCYHARCLPNNEQTHTPANRQRRSVCKHGSLRDSQSLGLSAVHRAT